MEKQKAPVTPLTVMILKMGFKFIKTEVAGEVTAHGFQHKNGTAALFMHGTADVDVDTKWLLKTADERSTAEGTTEEQFRTDYISLTNPHAKLDVTPGTLEALRQLREVTDKAYDLRLLKGNSNYTLRVQLLKKLTGSAKILVKESGLAALEKAFYKALHCTAKNFQACAAATFTGVTKRDMLEKKADKEKWDTLRRLTNWQHVVHDRKPVLEIKKLSKLAREKQYAALQAELADKECGAAAVPSSKAQLLGIDLSALRLRCAKNGVLVLQLEEPNSQGALCVYNNGRCVSAGVVSVERLAEMRAAEVDQMAIFNQACLLLTPPDEKTEVKPYAKAHLQMLLAAMDLAALRLEDGELMKKTLASIKPPAEHAQDVKISLENVGLLEDQATRIILLKLEKNNSQGATCVYNNGSKVSVGVVPNELLKTLRPVFSTDLVDDINQFLSPISTGVEVTPVAHRHLTALLECIKENTPMATATVTPNKKFAAPAATKKAAKSAKSAKPVKAAKSAKPVERKSSLFRLLNNTKSTWSAFTTQKGVIIAALVKLDAVGAKATGVTRSALIAALPDVPAANISFYLSKWQPAGIIEKLAAAE